MMCRVLCSIPITVKSIVPVTIVKLCVKIYIYLFFSFAEFISIAIHGRRILVPLNSCKWLSIIFPTKRLLKSLNSTLIIVVVVDDDDDVICGKWLV